MCYQSGMMSRRSMPAIDVSKHHDAFRRLAYEAIGCAPVVWKQGRLTISLDGKSLYYDLESDTSRIPALTTPELGDLCVELYHLMETDGQPWSECVIDFAKMPDDSWDFEVKFGYAEL
jgi:hypothetical protein